MFRTTILEDRMPKRKSPQLPLEQYEPGQYPPGEFVRTEEYPDGVHVRADGKPDPRKGKLTNRQMTFAKLIVEGIYSNAECARRAGFTDNTAREYARKLLDGQHFPHVVEYITELREERQRRYGVTTIGQLERLAKLSKGAEDAGQFSAAINAEKIRSAMGGLTLKAPSPPCFVLFPGSVSIDLAQKPWTEVQGQRFEDLGSMWEALRAEVRGHYARIAPCAP
jgi:DNA-binding CsgD family transcriptional regulator